MRRVKLRFVRSDMHLAEAVSGADGGLLAGAGTRLSAALVDELRRLGLTGVAVREAAEVADWEEDKDAARALADLEARFAPEPADPILAAVKAALARRLAAGSAS